MDWKLCAISWYNKTKLVSTAKPKMNQKIRTQSTSLKDEDVPTSSVKQNSSQTRF